MSTRPYVLSIAGFDPSSGAGLTADIKTFEQQGVYGLGVCSAITYQNDSEFIGVEWISVESIFKQIEVLFYKYPISYAKIGLIENIDILLQLIGWLNSKNIKIVWDPILKASAGYNFHNKLNILVLHEVLNKVYLFIPNIPEFNSIIDTMGMHNIKEFIASTNINAVLLKGGHGMGIECADILYYQGSEYVITGERFFQHSKHGTGCVLSSSVLAQLALGKSLPEACNNAKRYIEKFITGNTIHLGYHS